MVSASTQFGFAAELVAMLVAASGLVLVLWRRELIRGVGWPAPLGAFALLTGVAFAQGSLLAGGGAILGLAWLRLGGALLLVAGSWGWTGGRRSRSGLIAGGGLTAASAVLTLVSVSSLATSVVLGVASVVVAVALVAAGERSFAARVASNAAATLLLVVVVLSLALSSVITTSVEHQQLAAVKSLSVAQANDVVTLSDRAQAGAGLVAAGIEAYFTVPGRPSLAHVASGASAGRSGDRGLIASPLRRIATFDADTSVHFLAGRTTIPGAASIPGGGSVAEPPAVLAVARGLSCVRGAPGSTGHAAVVAAGGVASAVGAFAVCVTGPVRQVGTILAVTRIGDKYLAGIRSTAPSAAVAIVGPSGVTAAVGAVPSGSAVEAVQGPEAGAGIARVAGGRFVATVPVRAPTQAGGTPTSVWLVTSASTSSLASTRNSLTRTLFIIALGGTLLALVLAVTTGDRITSGVRRLTRVVANVGAGGSPSTPPPAWAPRGSSETAGADGRDEVGVLTSAFEAMIGAVDEKNLALRRAADDEARLRNRLEAVVASMGDALVAVDGLGRITDFNRAAEQLTAVSAATAVGAPATDVIFLSGDGVAGMRRHLDRLEAAPWSGQAELARLDGAVVPVAVSAGTLRGPIGEELGTVLVLRDLRKEQEIERMKTEFLSRVGHELRTPLTGILGYAELLVRREVAPDVGAAWLEEILTAAKRELRIVRLLEFFAAWGAGRNVARLEPVDIGKLVSGVAGVWAGRMQGGDRLSCRVQAGLPLVEVDHEWLVLALDEVLDNAIKYSAGKGSIAVSVRWVGPSSAGMSAAARPERGEVLAGGEAVAGEATFDAGAVEVAVTDQGVGMTADELARAFGAFEQADASDTRRFSGLGLGLSAVVQIIADHGGRVRCRSVIGQGTTLSLWLPVGAAARPPATNAGE